MSSDATTPEWCAAWPRGADALDKYDAFLFDCDGVLWRADQPVPGAVEALRGLRERGKKVLFVTNNSTKSRVMYLEKFRALGIEARKEEVFTSSSCVAWYLDRLEAFDKERQRPLVVGGVGIVRELEELGMRPLHASDVFPAGGEPPATSELAALEPPADIGAVLVGLDPHFTYARASLAMRALQRNDGCLFIASNRDSSYPTPGGLLPGAGAGLAMIEAAVGRTAVDTGKPRRHMFELAREAHGLDPARCLMVGDRHNTDILLGRTNGLDTLLVLSGVTQPGEVAGLRDDPATAPHFVAGSIAELLPA